MDRNSWGGVTLSGILSQLAIQKAVASIYGCTTWKLPSTNACIPFGASVVTDSDRLTVRTGTNAAIIIGNGVKRVLVSGKLSVGSGAGANVLMYISLFINGSLHATLGWERYSGAGFVSGGPILIAVEEGDELQLFARSTEANKSSAGGGWLSFLTVQAV